MESLAIWGAIALAKSGCHGYGPFLSWGVEMGREGSLGEERPISLGLERVIFTMNQSDFPWAPRRAGVTGASFIRCSNHETISFCPFLWPFDFCRRCSGRIPGRDFGAQCHAGPTFTRIRRSRSLEAHRQKRRRATGSGLGVRGWADPGGLC